MAAEASLCIDIFDPVPLRFREALRPEAEKPHCKSRIAPFLHAAYTQLLASTESQRIKHVDLCASIVVIGEQPFLEEVMEWLPWRHQPSAERAGAARCIRCNTPDGDSSPSQARGYRRTSNVSITVTGTNNAPVAQAKADTATQGGAVITGTMVANDVDVGTTLTHTRPQTRPPA